ncbi:MULTISPECIES: 3'-5' exonuclease [unclassified Campylobacter]|uniref:3'-5' exonuclease n=1 Tax=unclassified Campylobacter TaxID=2593542 RepID=UPI001BD9FAB0|nr:MULTISPECIES: 3'-5' exonuclease [unclassified Campylobacter]MBT0880308.1 3'-5' exonuclease [Campylobacter sp. 2018MI27]MBT0882721.1 3'-5' exonuclease [Campylobacter sp. 2018MI13]MBT0884378.1 3'-5' exonuclease [Campylobacter sp. 2018MI10]
MDYNELYKKQIANCDKILERLLTSSINYKDLKNQYENALNFEITYETLLMLGLDITLKQNQEVFLNSRNKLIQDEVFCVVDIESTGSISNGQIIEIGAVKIKNGEILDEFESFIYANEVPENIVELTGITTQMLKNAPRSARVLADFRLFLGNAIFVAHNVSFDYGFIAKESLEYLNAPLINRKLCTIMLARRCIECDKYGLDSLKNELGIISTHHRALSDAKACADILNYCINSLKGSQIKTSNDLILYSRSKMKK